MNDSPATVGAPDSIRVLYVDDDRSVTAVVKAHLERVDGGLEVETATGLEDGLEKLSTNGIDCIVSDFAMAGGTGLDFLESVREEYPDLPFILFTAKGSEAVASEAISAGVTDYLKKGGSTEHYAVLANRIRNAVDQATAIRERAAMRERMELALEKTDSLIFEIDLETDRVERHGAVEQFFDVDRESISTKEAFADEIVHPDDREQFRAFFEGFRRGEKRSDVHEFRTEPERGPVRWLRGHVNLVAEGQLLGLIQDVTEQKTREESLLQYKQSVESSKDLLAAVDEDLRYLFANQAYRHYHDLRGVAIESRSLPDVLTSDQFEAVEPSLRRALAGHPVQTELIRKHPNRGGRILDVRLFPLEDEDGDVQGVGASMRDVTSERELQDDLREAKERYESLFKSIRDAILVADTDRRIINCNPSFTELFGYELSEVEGKHTKYVYESEAEFEAMGKALEGHMDDPTFSYTVSYENKSGQTFPGETSVFYLRDAENEIVGFIGVIKDVTERRDRLKQIQNLDRVLQHNFHNDLTIIDGFAETIEREGARPQSPYAGKIRETGQELLATVDKEREITKFLSDPPPTVALELPRLCDQVVDRVAASYPNAEIVTRFDGSATVEASAAIERAIEELLTNSIVHSRAERPRVTVAVTVTDTTATIEVRDENRIIPEMERKVLTGEEELRPLYHGSGMGLWLVTLIVKHSDATLSIRQAEPTGNVVTIELPLD
ncbi:MAG: PAS domain S-box protein [Halodesulfurarchaeum sp.]|nr:PAS domain S-box protein [Halodesulfurarchaeum sp.]